MTIAAVTVGLVALSIPVIRSVSVQAQSLLFRMDYSTDASNFPNVEANDCWRLTRQPSGGPTGQPAFALRQLYCPSDSDGQHYWGHRGAVLSGSQIPSWGSTRYLRMRLKMEGANNYRTAGGGHVTNKLAILYEGCQGGNCRLILNIDNQRDGRWWLILGTDGGVSQIATPQLQNGVWYDIQLKMRYSSAMNVANGSTAIYVNNNNESTPTVQNTRILNAPGNHGHLGIGEFANGIIASDGVFTFYHSDFQFADAFDSGWSSGTGGSYPVPVPPTNVRVVR